MSIPDELIREYIARYTSGIFDGGRFFSFRRENAEALIHWLYAQCGLQKPVVMVAGNPYEAQLLFSFVLAFRKHYSPLLYMAYCMVNELPLSEHPRIFKPVCRTLSAGPGNDLMARPYVDSRLLEESGILHEALYQPLDDMLDLRFRARVDKALYSMIYTEREPGSYRELCMTLDAKLYSELYSSLHLEPGTPLPAGHEATPDLYTKLARYHDMYLPIANVCTNTELAWRMFIHRHIAGNGRDAKLETWNELYMQSGVYSALFAEGFCIISRYPVKVRRAASGALHNAGGPAVEWSSSGAATAWECYFLNGRHVAGITTGSGVY